MRTLRSWTNTNRIAPLSSLARPARHDCAARTVKSSRAAPWGRAGKVATSTWFDVSSSNCFSRAARRASASAGRIPAWSLTYSRGTGGGDCAAAAVAMMSHSGSAARTRVISRSLRGRGGRHGSGRRGRPPEVEVHVGRALGAGSGAEVRLLLEAEQVRRQHRREPLPRGVVRLRRLVVTVALDVDAVLGAFEL